MEKSLSQRIARLLEIINYFILVPTTLIEFFVLGSSFIALIQGQIIGFLCCSVITAVYAFGTLLLYGYRKHSRGKMSRAAVLRLWIGTILFNSIPAIWMSSFLVGDNHFTNGDQFWFYNIFGSYISVILLAVAALISTRHNFK